jgi:hypothetical protein
MARTCYRAIGRRRGWAPASQSPAAASGAMPRVGPTFIARSLRGTNVSGELTQEGESCELGS